MRKLALSVLPLAALALTLGCPAEKKAEDKPAEDKPAEDKKPEQAEDKPAEDKKPDKRVWFKAPPDGAKVVSPVHLVFGVAGMEISPAGQNMEDKQKGHHHLVIDGEPVPAGKAVPADDTHIHYGKGQTEVDVELKPGKHTLTMQFADGAHLSYGKDMSATINVEVVEGTGERKVMFKAPKDGAKVKSPVKLEFGVEGMTVRPAGEDPKDYTSGHHHVIVDGKPVPAATAVPADDTHIHFGKGQTETELKLEPGKHTLTLQFADGSHLSYGEAMSQTINVEVEK